MYTVLTPEEPTQTPKTHYDQIQFRPFYQTRQTYFPAVVYAFFFSIAKCFVDSSVCDRVNIFFNIASWYRYMFL